MKVKKHIVEFIVLLPFDHIYLYHAFTKVLSSNDRVAAY